MEWPALIVLDPTALDGQPRVEGSDLTVVQILDLLASGRSEAEIVASHADLTPAHVRACLAYGAAVVREGPALLPPKAGPGAVDHTV